MSILDRSALEQSPLADLHAIASELSLDGYRRLRKAELIAAIIERQGGDPSAGATAVSDATPEATADATPDATAAADAPDGADGPDAPDATAVADEEESSSRRRRGRRGGRGRSARDEAEAEAESPAQTAETPEPEPEESREAEVEGVVEVLPNGSAFLRVSPPEPSDNDVYVSAAQVKRCELVSGDRIAGPRRAPRRSERFASLVRVDTINGRPANEVADTARFDDLPADFAVERFRLGSEDPTLKAIEFLTPFGRGSRVAIVGPAQAGKTEALRLLARSLGGLEDVQILLALVGVRPEEFAQWREVVETPMAAVPLGASLDAQSQAIERVVDQGRRLAARGNHVALLIDALAAVTGSAARKALASARRIVDGGSLTVIATAAEPLGGETTVITLDAGLTAARRFPALDLAASWTMRPELLVGDGGAELIVRTRAEALER